MATTAKQMENQYPLPAWKFIVHMAKDTYAFSEVSGLSISYQTITYKDGINAPYHMPGQPTPVELTLRKGVIPGDSKLFDWISTVQMNTVEKRDITISLNNADAQQILVTWTVKNAFPKSLHAPTFNASANEVAIESLELMADSLSVTYKKP